MGRNEERCQPKGANFQAPKKDNSEFFTDEVLYSMMTIINNVICASKLLRLNLKCSCSKNIL